ncbi:MAG: hypothetical protein JNK27_02195, partial [Chitinophagaceae bacterium]|nr:hypothetical protein [Chitinophagaceae bacterium]
TRIIVSNFVDLQGNSTELGKYIAESFSVELSNKADLTVIDRTRFNTLLEELNLTDKKLTKPENALKLGEMAGVEFIITGTIVPLDNTIDISIKALDIQKGVSIAGQRGAVPRTDAINNLLRSSLNDGATTAANVNMAKKIDASNKSATDDIFEISISDLRKSECEAQADFGGMDYFGQACFENRTEYDLVIIVNAYIKIILPKGGRNCCPKTKVNLGGDRERTTYDYTYSFETTNTSPSKKGTFVITLEKCKIKSVVLTKSNLYLSAN